MSYCDTCDRHIQQFDLLIPASARKGHLPAHGALYEAVKPSDNQHSVAEEPAGHQDAAPVEELEVTLRGAGLVTLQQRSTGHLWLFGRERSAFFPGDSSFSGESG